MRKTWITFQQPEPPRQQQQRTLLYLVQRIAWLVV